MTRACSRCGDVYEGVDKILKSFQKKTFKKDGLSTACRRCESLRIQGYRDSITTPFNIVGTYCLLSEKPSTVNTCECCGNESHSLKESAEKFRKIRYQNDYPSCYLHICKDCEDIGCMVLSEMRFAIRNKKTLERDSEEYEELLEAVYFLRCHATPRDVDGKVLDILRFNGQFRTRDGGTVVPSAAGVRKIKLDVGYMKENINER